MKGISMIVDRLENWGDYPYGVVWEKAFEFLLALSPDVAEGEYPLQGEDAFARVMNYRTRPPEEALLETHREYADIQIVLKGAEAMEWYPAKGLQIQTPYDPGKDAQFYARPGSAPARMAIRPGFFAFFLPEDAHMPSLTVGESPEEVKKVVVKIRRSLLEG
jgi:biofilm protein TabA